MNPAQVIIGIVIGALVVGLTAWQVRARRRFAALPQEVQQGLRRAKEIRKVHRAMTKSYDRGVKVATAHLTQLESPKGRRLKYLGGVTLHERWIDTPQGSGSLIGVKAEAADESGMRQRLTATRMLTLGVFSLAAPKKKATGNAYVVIEGPQVSGVVTIAADKSGNAGPAAYSFAAEINNAARAAERAEPTRPASIQRAREALAKAQDRSDVDLTASAYMLAVAALPEEFRAKFSDASPHLQDRPRSNTPATLSAIAPG